MNDQQVNVFDVNGRRCARVPESWSAVRVAALIGATNVIRTNAGWAVKPPVPRARVSLYTRDGHQLTTYTCPEGEAHARAGQDIADERAAGTDAYAVVAGLGGQYAYRLDPHEAAGSEPSTARFLLLDDG